MKTKNRVVKNGSKTATIPQDQTSPEPVRTSSDAKAGDQPASLVDYIIKRESSEGLARMVCTYLPAPAAKPVFETFICSLPRQEAEPLLRSLFKVNAAEPAEAKRAGESPALDRLEFDSAILSLTDAENSVTSSKIESNALYLSTLAMMGDLCEEGYTPKDEYYEAVKRGLFSLWRLLSDGFTIGLDHLSEGKRLFRECFDEASSFLALGYLSLPTLNRMVEELAARLPGSPGSDLRDKIMNSLYALQREIDHRNKLLKPCAANS